MVPIVPLALTSPNSANAVVRTHSALGAFVPANAVLLWGASVLASAASVLVSAASVLVSAASVSHAAAAVSVLIAVASFLNQADSLA